VRVPIKRAVHLGLLAAVACGFGWLGVVHADALPNPWSKIKKPSEGDPRSVGEYSTGCLRGGQALPLEGEGFVVMHPSRTRYFGHPDLLQFIRTLGKGLNVEGLDPVLVGDLSQPRGGPAPGGHSSHQTGLDVDLWFWHPGGKITAAQRESLKSRSILDGKAGTIRDVYAKRVKELLRLTARDPRVTRVFVHPIIKRQLCSEVTEDRDWLSKIRPWYGHDDHMHVRLDCPADSKDCTPQHAVGGGDGCKELDWWFSPEASADRAKGQKTYQDKVGKAPRMPEQCFEVLREGATAATEQKRASR
jgi:penicillin-insensitive murein DD-endopeptidase